MDYGSDLAQDSFLCTCPHGTSKLFWYEEDHFAAKFKKSAKENLDVWYKCSLYFSIFQSKELKCTQFSIYFEKKEWKGWLMMFTFSYKYTLLLCLTSIPCTLLMYNVNYYNLLLFLFFSSNGSNDYESLIYLTKCHHNKWPIKHLISCNIFFKISEYSKLQF